MSNIGAIDMALPNWVLGPETVVGSSSICSIDLQKTVWPCPSVAGTLNTSGPT